MAWAREEAYAISPCGHSQDSPHSDPVQRAHSEYSCRGQVVELRPREAEVELAQGGVELLEADDAVVVGVEVREYLEGGDDVGV